MGPLLCSCFFPHHNPHFLWPVPHTGPITPTNVVDTLPDARAQSQPSQVLSLWEETNRDKEEDKEVRARWTGELSAHVVDDWVNGGETPPSTFSPIHPYPSTHSPTYPSNHPSHTPAFQVLWIQNKWATISHLSMKTSIAIIIISTTAATLIPISTVVW